MSNTSPQRQHGAAAAAHSTTAGARHSARAPSASGGLASLREPPVLTKGTRSAILTTPTRSHAAPIHEKLACTTVSILLSGHPLPQGAIGASFSFSQVSIYFDRACVGRRVTCLARRPAMLPRRRSGARSGTRPPARAPRGPPRAARPRPPRRRAAPRTAPAPGSACRGASARPWPAVEFFVFASDRH